MTTATALSPSQTKRRDWLHARLSKLEVKDARRGLNRQDRSTYGRYLDEYRTLTEGEAPSK